MVNRKWRYIKGGNNSKSIYPDSADEYVRVINSESINIANSISVFWWQRKSSTIGLDTYICKSDNLDRCYRVLNGDDEKDNFQVEISGDGTTWGKEYEYSGGIPSDILVRLNNLKEYRFATGGYVIKEDSLYGKGFELVNDSHQPFEGTIPLSQIESIQL